MTSQTVTRLLPAATLIFAFACGSSGPSPKTASAQPEESAGQAGVQATTVAQNTDAAKAPEFKVQKLDGSPVTLADYAGKVVIVDFWATWCPPCLKGIPEFGELYNAYKDQGLAILGISVDRAGSGVVQKFVEKNKVPYDIAMATMEVVDAYEVFTGIPTTFVIDRQGKLVDKVIGYQPKSYFENKVKELLALPPA